MKTVLIYMTASSKEEADKIGRTLLENRLAACINILPNMQSMYWWEGKIEQSAEVVLMAKTREDLVGALTQQVKELHSYECPCIVSVPIEGGNPDFLKWIEAETDPSM